MVKEVSKNAMTVIRKMQQNELTESVIYEGIAKFAKGEENKKTLLRLAAEGNTASQAKQYIRIWQDDLGL